MYRPAASSAISAVTINSSLMPTLRPYPVNPEGMVGNFCANAWMICMQFTALIGVGRASLPFAALKSATWLPGCLIQRAQSSSGLALPARGTADAMGIGVGTGTSGSGIGVGTLAGASESVAGAVAGAGGGVLM